MPSILVIEDDMGMLEWLSEVLTSASYEVVAIQDSMEARSLSKRRFFDAIITDLSMPNLDGEDLILAARQEQPGLKIIVISGRDDGQLIDAKILGADAALQKPVGRGALLRCLAEFLPIAAPA